MAGAARRGPSGRAGRNRRGWLARPDRAGPGRGVRRYASDDVRRLRFIRSAQAAGFTLDRIGELLALDAGEDRARAHALARRQIETLDARIAELRAARDALTRLARECSRGGAGPCPIIVAFEHR